MAQKIAGVLLPVTVFVAAGFEHSVANMYLLPYAYLLEYRAGEDSMMTIANLGKNIAAATTGNILGGCLLGLTYGFLFSKE